MVWIAREFLLPNSWLKIEINEWIMKKEWLEWQKAIFTLLRDCIQQIDAMLPFVCSVVDHRWYHDVVRREFRTGLRLVCHFLLFLLRVDVISHLLLDRSTATWNLFVSHTWILIGFCFWYKGDSSIVHVKIRTLVVDFMLHCVFAVIDHR